MRNPAPTQKIKLPTVSDFFPHDEGIMNRSAKMTIWNTPKAMLNCPAAGYTSECLFGNSGAKNVMSVFGTPTVSKSLKKTDYFGILLAFREDGF